jgi:diguanylate cyclase (GGDEF)-like protein
LTGLLNRAGFESYLKGKVKQGDDASLAALYIDLDYLKLVNDQHGHASGDEVLRQFAERVQNVVRPTDAVARLGGDEFGVVVAHVRSVEDAAQVAEWRATRLSSKATSFRSVRASA